MKETQKRRKEIFEKYEEAHTKLFTLLCNLSNPDPNDEDFELPDEYWDILSGPGIALWELDCWIEEENGCSEENMCIHCKYESLVERFRELEPCPKPCKP